MALAYYNEIDPFAAAWLRELINAGHIAPGEVDERDIRDVRPTDLARFRQCHFFAGIGVWSYALRRAGWSDSRPIWTGSCPCQPFSAAGKGAGFADERHLWPAWYWLIEQCGPVVVAGEQVASSNVDPWLDLVQADVEAMDYAFGCVPVPAAGFGSPNIRDRAFWLAHADGRDASAERQQRGGEQRLQPQDRGAVIGLDHAASARQLRSLGDAEGDPRHEAWLRLPGAGREADRLDDADDADDARLEGFGGGYQAPIGRLAEAGPTAEAIELGGLADANDTGFQPGRIAAAAAGHGHSANADGRNHWTAPTNGFWRNADWLGCRDGKWRPVEPGTSPLAHGAPARVGRLRGYGNAINAEVATSFIEAVMDHLDGAPLEAAA